MKIENTYINLNTAMTIKIVSDGDKGYVLLDNETERIEKTNMRSSEYEYYMCGIADMLEMSGCVYMDGKIV